MKLDKYTVGRRYGNQDLVSLRQIYEQVPGLGNMLSDVRLEPHEKREIMDKLVSGYDGIVKNFLEVVYAYNRMDDLLFMIEEYERRYDEHQGLLLGSSTFRRTTNTIRKECCKNNELSISRIKTNR